MVLNCAKCSEFENLNNHKKNMVKSITENPYGAFSTEDYSVFVVMLSISAGIGIYFGFFEGKKNQTTEDYLLGGRKMKIFPIAVSLIAR